MANRPRPRRRVCASCGHLEDSGALIAPDAAEAHHRLTAEGWSCACCGSGDYLVTTRYEDSDLEGVPIPIRTARAARQTEH